MYLPLSLLSCPEKIGLPSSNGKAKIGKRTIAGRLLSKLLSCMNTIATEHGITGRIMDVFVRPV